MHTNTIDTKLLKWKASWKIIKNAAKFKPSKCFSFNSPSSCLFGQNISYSNKSMLIMIDNQFEIIYSFFRWREKWQTHARTRSCTCQIGIANNKSDSPATKRQFFTLHFISVYSFDLYWITNIAQGISLHLGLAWNPACGTDEIIACFRVRVCVRVALYESPQILIDSLAEWKFSSCHGHLLLSYILKMRSIQYLDVLHVMYQYHQWWPTTQCNFLEKSEFSFCIDVLFLFVFAIGTLALHNAIYYVLVCARSKYIRVRRWSRKLTLIHRFLTRTIIGSLIANHVA